MYRAKTKVLAFSVTTALMFNVFGGGVALAVESADTTDETVPEGYTYEETAETEDPEDIPAVERTDLIEPEEGESTTETEEADPTDATETEATESGESSEEVTPAVVSIDDIDDVSDTDVLVVESDETETTEAVEAVEEPAFDMTVSLDDVDVRVMADEGVLPAGATLSVSVVDDVDTDELIDREDNEIVALSTVYDITIFDENGQEIQPDGDVRVLFYDTRFADSNLTASVYHIEDEEAVELDYVFVDENDEITEDIDEMIAVEAVTDGFSYYTVEFTYEEMEYTLSGGADVALSEILNTLGLEGDVTATSVSNNTLFNVIEENGVLVVRSLQAFDTEEWLKVTINGVEYTIVVTDAQTATVGTDACAAILTNGTLVFYKSGDSTVPSNSIGHGPWLLQANYGWASESYPPWHDYVSEIHAVDVRAKIVGLTSMVNYFYQCQFVENWYNLENFDTSAVTSFFNCFKETNNALKDSDLYGIGMWDMSSATRLQAMFNKCQAITSIDALRNWNVDNVTNFRSMFFRCTSLEDIDAVNSWNFAHTSNLQTMFMYCTNLRTVTFNPRNTSDVSNMYGVFAQCTNLVQAQIYIEGNAVTDCHSMFEGCTSLDTVELAIDTGNATDMSDMFLNCDNLNTITPVNGFDFGTSNISDPALRASLPDGNWEQSVMSGTGPIYSSTDLRDSFNPNTMLGTYTKVGLAGSDAYAILYDSGKMVFQIGDTPDPDEGTVVSTWLVTAAPDTGSGVSPRPWNSNTDITSIDFKDPIEGITSGFNFFYGLTNLASITNIDNLGTSAMTAMNGMFQDCQSLASIDLNYFDTSSVTNIGNMFYGCSSLTSLDLSSMDVSNAYSRACLFTGCSNLSSIDMSGWVWVNGPGSMAGVFSGFNPTNGVALDASEWSFRNGQPAHVFGRSFADSCIWTDIDVSNWDLSNLTSLQGFFCSPRIQHITGLDTWDVSGISSFDQTFQGASSLSAESLADTEGWDMSSATNLSNMFNGCYQATSFDLSGWNVENVTNFGNMFAGNYTLTELNVSGWDTSAAQNFNNFIGGTAIEEIDLTSFNTANTTGMNSMLASTALNKIIISDDFVIPANQTATTGYWRVGDTSTVLPAFANGQISDTTPGNTYWRAYPVTFDPNGGTINGSTDTVTIYYSENVQDAFPADAERTAYNFMGWVDGDGVQYTQIVADMPDTLYASWSDYIPQTATVGVDAYAILYTDGSLVFQKGNIPDPDKTVAQGPLLLTANNNTWSTNNRWNNTATSMEFKDNIVGRTSLYRFFGYMNKVTSISHLERLDTSRVTNLTECFASSKVTSFPGLETWDMSSVACMDRMFASCTNITDLSTLPFENWEFERPVTMNYMFQGCSGLTSLDGIEDLDMSHTTSTGAMFQNCNKITNVDALADWDMSNNTNMASMFQSCTALLNADGIAGWDFSKVLSTASMFKLCSKLTSVPDFENKDWSSVTDMNSMFYSCTKLTDTSGLEYLDLTALTDMGSMFYQAGITDLNGLRGWNTPALQNMAYAFYRCASLADTTATIGWDLPSLTNMASAFYQDTSLVNLNGLSGWNTPALQNLSSTFYGCTGLTDVDGLSDWDTPALTTMNRTFINCRGLLDIDGLTDWDTPALTNMERTFYGVNKVTNLDALAGWDVSHVTTLNSTFYNMAALADISGLSSWNTGSVTNMASTFYGDRNITDYVPLSGWDVSSVTSLYSAFNNNTGLTDTDVFSEWRTPALDTAYGMFEGCSNLTTLDGLADWGPTHLTNMSCMCTNCSSLVDMDGIADWDTQYVTTFGSLFSGCSSLEEIDMGSWDMSASWDSSYNNTSSMFTNCNALWKITLPETFRTAYATTSYNEPGLNGMWYRESDGARLQIRQDVLEGFDETDADTYYKEFTLNFYPMGGTVEPATIKLSVLGTDEDFPTPVRTGYTFLGWYDADGNLYTEYPVGQKLTKLYAHWDVAETYAIVFDPNGVEGINAVTRNVAFDESTQLNRDVFGDVSGYSLISWNTEPDGSGTEYSVNATVMRLAENPGDTITLYAQWVEQVPMTITVHYIDYKTGGELGSATYNTVSGSTWEDLGTDYYFTTDDSYTAYFWSKLPGLDGESRMDNPDYANSSTQYKSWYSYTSDNGQVVLYNTVLEETDTDLYVYMLPPVGFRIWYPQPLLDEVPDFTMTIDGVDYASGEYVLYMPFYDPTGTYSNGITRYTTYASVNPYYTWATDANGTPVSGMSSTTSYPQADVELVTNRGATFTAPFTTVWYYLLADDSVSTTGSGNYAYTTYDTSNANTQYGYYNTLGYEYGGYYRGETYDFYICPHLTVDYNLNTGNPDTDSHPTRHWLSSGQNVDPTEQRVAYYMNTNAREGYTFLGWSYTPDGEVAIPASDTESARFNALEHTVLYAQWELTGDPTITPEPADSNARYIRITYNTQRSVVAPGTSFSNESQIMNMYYDVKYQESKVNPDTGIDEGGFTFGGYLPELMPIRDYMVTNSDGTTYYFDGWYTEPNGQGIKIEEGTDVYCAYTESMTLYGHWIEGVKIYFNAFGVNAPSSIDDLTYYGATNYSDGYKANTDTSIDAQYYMVMNPNVPIGNILKNINDRSTPATKTFIGWFMDDTDAQMLTGEELPIADHVYWAHWSSDPAVTTVTSGDIEYSYRIEWANVSNRVSADKLWFVNKQPEQNMIISFSVNSPTQTLPAGAISIKLPYEGSMQNVAQYPDTTYGGFFSYRVVSPTWSNDTYIPGYYELINTVPISGAGIEGVVEIPAPTLRQSPTDKAYTVSITVDEDVDGTPEYEYEKEMSWHFEGGVSYLNGASYYQGTYYQTWNSSWGAQPAGSENYFYIDWELNASRSNSSYVDGRGAMSATAVGAPAEGVYTVKTTSRNTGSGSYRLHVIRAYPMSMIDPESGRCTVDEQFAVTWNPNFVVRGTTSPDTMIIDAEKTVRWERYTHVMLNYSMGRNGTAREKNVLENFVSATGSPITNLQWHVTYENSSPINREYDHGDLISSEWVNEEIALSVLPGDVYYNSGAPDDYYDWHPEFGNEVLGQEDYAITNLSIIRYSRTADAELDESMLWATSRIYTDPITVDLYVQRRGDTEPVYYNTYTFNNGSTSQQNITLPGNIVGVVAKTQTNGAYYSYFRILPTLKIMHTDRMVTLMGNDYNQNASSVIKLGSHLDITYPDYGGYNPADFWDEVHMEFSEAESTGSALLDLYEITGNRLGDVSIYAEGVCSSFTNNSSTGIQSAKFTFGVRHASTEATDYRNITDGTFYIYLPAGATARDISLVYGRTQSAMPTSGNRVSGKVPDSKYTVEQVDNWGGTGRAMLIVSFHDLTDRANSCNVVDCKVTVEKDYFSVMSTGTAGSIPFLFVNETPEIPDDYVTQSYQFTENHATNNPNQAFSSIAANNQQIRMVTNYANRNFQTITTPQYGYSATIANSSGVYGATTTVFPGEDFSYRLRYSQPSGTRTGNIHIQDTLDGVGTLVSVDAPSMSGLNDQGQNTTCVPVIWYSLDENPDFDNIDATHGWTTDAPVGQVVKGLYVDYSTDINGDPFILNDQRFITVTVNETNGPWTDGRTFTSESEFDYSLYNGLSPSTDGLLYQGVTGGTVALPTLEITNRANPASGTEAEPREVKRNSSIQYTITVTNNSDRAVQDLRLVDPLPDSLIWDYENIRVDGLTLADAGITDYDFTNGLNLVIPNLSKNGSVTITVPTIADAPAETRIETTAHITEVFGVALEPEQVYNSNTTYHSILLIVPDPTGFNANFIKEALPLFGVTLCLLLIVYEVKPRRKEETSD